MKFIDESLLPEPPIGAHLVSPRRGFTHHGLYIGKGKVIHYSGMARSLGVRELGKLPRLIRYGSVVKTSLKYFCDGHGFKVVKHPHARFKGEAAVARARKRLCERSYYLYGNNCEHFVNWCIDDEFKSPFITRLVLGVALALSLIQWCVSGRAARSSSSSARLIFGTLCSVSGAFVSLFFTAQALQPAEGMRGRERRNRYFGRIGMHFGALAGVTLAIFGIQKHSRLALSLAPYMLPTFFGLGTYGVSRHYDTLKKERIRKERVQKQEAGEAK